MTKFKLTITLLTLLVLGGCNNEVTYDQLELVERSGLMHEINSQIPYTGVAVEYHDNGQLSFKGNYKDGELDGLAKGYFDNGQLRFKDNYKDGKLEFSKEFYEDGQLKEKRN